MDVPGVINREMKIRIVSDLHLEFDNSEFTLPILPDDKDSVLVLAGDIGIYNSGNNIYYKKFFKSIKRFRKVIYIPGNHEYYGNSIDTTLGKMEKILSVYKNVNLINKKVIDVDDISFICATLWTNFNDNDWHTMVKSRLSLNDYNFISVGMGERYIIPNDIYNINLIESDFLFTSIMEAKEKNRKVVVVSHHLPSYASIAARFKGDILNGAFASNYDYRVMVSQPDLWIHGHTHDSFDYMLDQTRVICNPRGYYGKELNPDFDDRLVVDI